jgi:hypothetical protein
MKVNPGIAVGSTIKQIQAYAAQVTFLNGVSRKADFFTSRA